MYLLPLEFVGVVRLTYLVGMTDADDAQHLEAGRNAEQLLDVEVGGVAIGIIAVAHLYPHSA